MIKIKDLSFTYTGQMVSGDKAVSRGDAGRNGSTPVHCGVRDIQLHIPKGACVLLAGRSGCGKSTLIKLLGGLIPRYYRGDLNGEIWLGDSRIDRLQTYELASRVGIVFQNPRTQFFNVDVSSEIVFGMENLGFDPVYMQSRKEEVIRDLALEDLAERSIFELSGGEKQRVAFASVYALNPDIYLLDEPSSNLDHHTMAQLAAYLRLIKAQGKTIVIAEHRLHYLMDIADQVVYMNEGRIRQIYGKEAFEALEDSEISRIGLRARNIENVVPALKTENVDPDQRTDLDEHIKKQRMNHLKGRPNHGGLLLDQVRLYQKKRPILDDIHLQAAQGDIIAVTGRNGIGKTTLIRALCGILKSCEGSFIFDGKAMDMKARRKLAYLVMQDVNYQLFAESVMAECTFGLDHYDPREVTDQLKYFGLYDFREMHPNTLSGGQKQRLAIITACISGRKVLAFDEPTSGLDYDSMQAMSKLLREIAGNRIIFVITHDYEFICSACSRMLHIGEHGLLEIEIIPEHKDEILRCLRSYPM